MKASLLLCTSSTNGHLALWPLEPSPHIDAPSGSQEQLYFSRETPRRKIALASALKWTTRIRIHQSSIKSISAVQGSNDEIVLATAGDDGAIGFTRISCSNMDAPRPDTLLIANASQRASADPSITHSTLLIPKAHDSAVTALQHVSSGPDEAPYCQQKHRFVTSGNDQRVKVWQLTCDLSRPGVEGFAVHREQSVATAVADVAAIEKIRGDERGVEGFVLAGIGMEIWSGVTADGHHDGGDGP